METGESVCGCPAMRAVSAERARRAYAGIGGAREERLLAGFRAAMEALPLTPKQKALVLLKLDGVTERRIAGAWGVSRQAVERMWARARRSLRAAGEPETRTGLSAKLGAFGGAQRRCGWQGVYLETARTVAGR